MKKRNEKGYWTTERLQKEVNNYQTRLEFQKNNRAGYIAAFKENLLDELFKNSVNKGYKNKTNWSLETLQEEANKYKSRLYFRKNNVAAYSSALSRNLLDELFKDHPNKGYKNKPPGYWTFDKLQEEANKYDTRGEFQKNSSGYGVAYDKKIIDKLFENHKNNGYKNVEKWKENNYVIYVYELLDYKKAYVGLTNNIDRRDKEHLFGEGLLYNFVKENNIPYPKFKILEKNLKSNDAREKEEYWINYYKNNNWMMFNSAKPGSLGRLNLKWTIKSLQKEANKYNSRNDFRKNSSAYITAKRMKILNILFKNHKNQGFNKDRVRSKYWSLEILQNEANKYKTRLDFKKNSNPACVAANRKKLMNELFKNHKNQGYIRKLKKELEYE